jgi:hypothetical protein
VYQPILTGVALLILTSLSGFLPLSILLSTDFALSTTSANPTMSTVILALGIAGPCVSVIVVRKTGKKILMLVSTAAMTAAALFLALLSHFQDQGRIGLNKCIIPDLTSMTHFSTQFKLHYMTINN